MKQSGSPVVAASSGKGEAEAVSTEYIWETFDSLFKTVHRQGRRVEELEARVVELERRLQERTGLNPVARPSAEKAADELPAEKAA